MRSLLGARIVLALTTALSSAAVFAEVPAQAPAAASLEDQFREPPNSARPRVWWHWMNGNISKDGIAKDLAWMKRVGIGGLQNFDANIKTPQIVDKRLVYMTPEWKDAFRFAAREADRLGLELAIASSPGWSATGGPWVKPEDGMKKLVWSETEVAGGRRFTGKLAAPPAEAGPYQALPFAGDVGSVMDDHHGPARPTHFADVAVLAYPVSTSSTTRMVPTVVGGDGKALDTQALGDADLATGVDLVKAAGAAATLRLQYPRAQTVRAATLYMPGVASVLTEAPFLPKLEASDDGKTWRPIADVPLRTVPTTIAFAPVTAREFRLTFVPVKSSGTTPAPQAQGVDLFGLLSSVGGAAALGAAKPMKVTDFRLIAEDRIDQAETKAGFRVSRDYYALAKDLPDTNGVAPNKVVDLTGRMKSDGSLDWTPPGLPGGGHWRVVRLGYSLTGTMNHPATPEATGLEVDKFDGAAVRRYMEQYLGMYKDAAGAELVGKRGIRAILNDSIEAGGANWTPQLVTQFRRLRGYDPTPWLPTLTGTVIGSRAQSDKFLYDYRRTLSDLIASEHYGTIAKVAHENDLLVYGEALETLRVTLGDDMAMRRHTDIPMAALWTFPREDGPNPGYWADMKGAASVAHVYGQNLVAAESMTAMMTPWAFGPRDLKRVIDLEFVAGINRPVVHTSVHAPTDDKKPGLSLFIFGQYFNRHESWAELAKPWIDYISRNSLMLQQGRNFADVAYFYGEEAPLTALYGDKPVANAPKRYAYDFVNADALVGALANDGNELVASGGARYRALYLGGSARQMTLPTLRRIAALVEGGATVIGPKPVADPSLVGDGREFAALSAKLWSATAETRVGKGRVLASTDVETGLQTIGVTPDFHFAGGQPDSDIPFVHRRLPDGDSYFLANRRNRTETIEARFRVTGKAPELWHAETGKAEAVSYRIENGETIVPLTLAPEQSLHVVFRKPAVTDALAIKKPAPVEVGRVGGPWQVAFEAGRGAPPKATFDELAPLNERTETGIKYFSGIATYSNTFVVPKGWRRGQPLWLDLGDASEVAEVSVNGRLAGYAWHPPYRVDVGQTAKPGRNAVQIRVANLWVNRLIGDKQPGAKPVTWTSLPTYIAKAPLRRSGLIGPVTLWGQK